MGRDGHRPMGWASRRASASRAVPYYRRSLSPWTVLAPRRLRMHPCSPRSSARHPGRCSGEVCSYRWIAFVFGRGALPSAAWSGSAFSCSALLSECPRSSQAKMLPHPWISDLGWVGYSMHPLPAAGPYPPTAVSALSGHLSTAAGVSRARREIRQAAVNHEVDERESLVILVLQRYVYVPLSATVNILT